MGSVSSWLECCKKGRVIKKYVIAGDSVQAKNWIINDLNSRVIGGETTLSWSEYVIVSSPDQLRGIRNPKGIFIGAWNERADLAQLLTFLLISMDDTNPSQKVIQDLLVSNIA
jgi:hypothetical protein